MTSNQKISAPLFKEESLEISGYRDEQVANTFFRQLAPTKHLVIILPGAGYGARMPLFYYTVSLFLEHQADILTIDYEYRSHAARYASDFEDRLTENVTSSIRDAVRQRTYDQVTLIGKSIGTRAMSWFLAKNQNLLTTAYQLKTVWLTPVWSDPKIFTFMKSWAGPALHIIGTADHGYFSEECERQLKELKSTTVLTIKDADHSLDIDGDIAGSLNAIRTAVRAIEDFIFGSSKL